MPTPDGCSSPPMDAHPPGSSASPREMMETMPQTGGTFGASLRRRSPPRAVGSPTGVPTPPPGGAEAGMIVCICASICPAAGERRRLIPHHFKKPPLAGSEAEDAQGDAAARGRGGTEGKSPTQGDHCGHRGVHRGAAGMLAARSCPSILLSARRRRAPGPGARAGGGSMPKRPGCLRAELWKSPRALQREKKTPGEHSGAARGAW